MDLGFIDAVTVVFAGDQLRAQLAQKIHLRFYHLDGPFTECPASTDDVGMSVE